ncbi:hypothetical protein AVEN_89800-1 [Araneus ventricosus]|uniref:Uncharacterized protein n=1 Tax=Araneus ventricosus TaxID=182803 RepID=A0A4Y2I4E4_ARAVE|nr:hypothetical protein AVEN_89800-1 [Araneus ventricosus]
MRSSQFSWTLTVQSCAVGTVMKFQEIPLFWATNWAKKSGGSVLPRSSALPGFPTSHLAKVLSYPRLQLCDDAQKMLLGNLINVSAIRDDRLHSLESRPQFPRRSEGCDNCSVRFDVKTEP